MEKLDPKTDGVTTDIVKQNIEKLKELFPDVFTEGSDEEGPRWKVDFDALREILGEYAEDQPERYSFNWNGKSRARLIAQTPSTGALRPCPEESVNWDTTQNLFIEGDNLEVLKLLQKSYHKKIKMIYIDPPYNTGKEFIYPDKYKDNLNTYLRYSGQVDEEGLKLSANTETSGRYHTNWLNMMYPRLKLARNLLQDDGVMLISIDDAEIPNLRHLCNEIFGEENFVAQLIIESDSRARQYGAIATTHEYMLVYSKNQDYSYNTLSKENKKFLYEDEDGGFDIYELRNRNVTFNIDNRPNLYYPFWVNPRDPDKNGFHQISIEEKEGWAKTYPQESQGIKTVWRWGKDKSSQNLNTILMARKHRGGFFKIIKKYRGTTFVYNSVWADKYIKTDKGTLEMKALFDNKKIFDFPKPTELVKRVIKIFADEDSVVFDFFSGSATTAHAVLDLNKEDGSNRTFIMAQLPEPCDKNSEAFKAKYKNIADIGKERIRRVIKKIEAEQAEKAKEIRAKLPGMTEEIPELDLGFKIFKLDSSNIIPWDGGFDNLEEELFNAIENIKPDRSEEDVLYELLLKYGLDLALPIEERKIDGKTVYIIGAGALIVCLANKIRLEVVEGIAALKDELKPEIMRVVFKDAGFADDVVKTNAGLILRQAGIEDIKSL